MQQCGINTTTALPRIFFSSFLTHMENSPDQQQPPKKQHPHNSNDNDHPPPSYAEVAGMITRRFYTYANFGLSGSTHNNSVSTIKR